jgi:hypothetical protein
MHVCKQCGDHFSPENFENDYEELRRIADYCGMEALTESAQALLNMDICPLCYVLEV